MTRSAGGNSETVMRVIGWRKVVVVMLAYNAGRTLRQSNDPL